MSTEQDPGSSLPSHFDVRAWLERIHLPQYADSFAQNEISAVALPMLTEEDLKACGVTVLGHRKIILHEIHKLTSGETAPDAAAPPAAPAAPAAPAPAISPPAAPSPPALGDSYQTQYIFTTEGVEISSGILEPGEYRIGRDATCDFVFTDKLISRKHARLTITAGQWMIEDLGSSGGTLLNDYAITEPTHILPTQRVQFGPVTLVLRRVPIAPPPAPAPQAVPPPRPMVATTVLAHPQRPAAASLATTARPADPAPPADPRAGKARPGNPPAGGKRAVTPAALSPQQRAQRSRHVWTKQPMGFWARVAASKFLIVSIAAHLFFGVGAAVYVVQRYQASRKVTFQGGPPLVSASKRVLEHKVSMAKKKNTMSAPAQAKRITTTGLSKVTLPDMPALPNAMEVMPRRMSGMGGMGTGPGFGSGGGMGTGVSVSGGSFTLPKAVGDRCSAASRAAALKASGGDPKCEDAVVKALGYLKAQQNPDGSFGSGNKNAMTGLALLSFLGHCEKPNSQEFGPTVRKAIDYLVKFGAENNGKLGRGTGNGWAYEHGIAAYALGEAYIFTREEPIADVLRPAIKIIVDGQGPDGGWVYGFTKSGDGDTSVSGWQIQALKAAHLTDLNIDGVEASMKKAMDDMLRVHGAKGGFGYRTKGDKWSLTGVGVFSLQIGTGQRGGPVRNGLEFILNDKNAQVKYKGPDGNLYAWYYHTQACFQAGGYFWGKWNRAFQPEVLEHQMADGSWEETGGVASDEGDKGFDYKGTGNSMDAKVYRTSLCVLMLEVFYRYLATNRS